MPKPGVCAKCEGRLEDEALVAMNKLWHRDHFLCFKCEKPIEHGFIPTEQDEPYCITCYADTFNPRCHGCKEVLHHKCIRAMGAEWHKTCFVCTLCKKEFPKGEYFLIDDLPYDLDCHWEKRLESHLAKMAEQQDREVKKSS